MRMATFVMAWLCSSFMLQGCAATTPESLGLKQLKGSELGSLVQRGATFSSTRDGSQYRLAGDGKIDVVTGSGTGHGHWQISNDRICVTIAPDRSRDCYEVFSSAPTLGGPFHFRGASGHLSEPYTRSAR